MLLGKARSNSPTVFKNSSLSSSVSSASSASSSFKRVSPSQLAAVKRGAELDSNSSFRPTSFSYHTFNPNRVSSYDNENFYQSSQVFPSGKADELEAKQCRKRASIACANSTSQEKPKSSLLSRALTYSSSKPGSNSSWRLKLGKYLSSTNSAAAKKTKKPDHDEIYSSYHLARKNPIQLQANSNTNIFVSSSSCSSSSSHASPSPKTKNPTSSLQKLSITSGFNSLRKMLRIKSSGKPSLHETRTQTLNGPSKKRFPQIKKQLSFNQNDSILRLFGSKQDEPVLNSTRNDLSCFNSNLKNLSCVRKECNCVDMSGSTLFNNILSSSPITIRNFDRPEQEAVPDNVSCSNVKMYDGYRSLIKQIEELKMSRQEDEMSEEDLKCDMEVASFFTRTIKCHAVNNYFSTNDLVNYDYLQSTVEAEDEEQNLDFLVKQLVAEASLSDMAFEKKMNSTEQSYENMALEDKNSLDLSEYVDMAEFDSSSPESFDADLLTKSRQISESSYESHLPAFSSFNSLAPVTNAFRTNNYSNPAQSHSNSIKIEKKIRLNYRRPHGGYVPNANYFNFGTLC